MSDEILRAVGRIEGQLTEQSKKLDNLADWVQCVDRKTNEVRLEVAGLKVKAGVWGALAGLIPVVLGLGLLLIEKALGK